MKNHSEIPSQQPLHRRSLWLSLNAILAITACATLSNAPPQEQVRQRATERWQALVAGEFSRAYGYSTPGFKAVVSPDGYRNRFGSAVTWLGSEVVKVDCPETKRCMATLRIDIKPTLSRKIGDKISTHVDETWLLENGQWYFFQDIK